MPSASIFGGARGSIDFGSGGASLRERERERERERDLRGETGEGLGRFRGWFGLVRLVGRHYRMCSLTIECVLLL